MICFCDNACLVMSLLFIQTSSEERTLAHRQCNDGRCNFDFVEYFCGKGELTRHLLKKGFWGAAVDLINDAEAQDCLEPCGLRLFSQPPWCSKGPCTDMARNAM